MKTEIEIAKYIANIKYEHLPIGVVDYTKKCIMDTVGVAIAGSSFNICDNIVNQVKGWGGKKESTIWVFGGKVPCQNAAIPNGTMTRVLDFSGVHERAVSHPNETIVPAALAIAEKEKVSGQDLIVAVAVGIDLTARLKLVRRFKGFIGEPTIGAAATASKVMRLDENKTLSALGNAYCMAAGTLQMVQDTASYLYISHGMKASTGILSALLARRGITGPGNFLEGEFGFYNIYENKEEYDLSELTKELGERFETTNISLKPYPTCRFTHSAIQGVLELIKGKKIDPQDISSVEIRVNELAFTLTCVPEEKKLNPREPVEAQYSMPYLIGAAIVKKDVFISEVGDGFTSRASDAFEVAKKVKCYLDRNIEKTGAKVEVSLKGGEKLEKIVRIPPGHPDNPFSLAQVEEKFKKCVQHAAIPIPQKNIDESIGLLSKLENVRDVSKLFRLIAN